MKSKPVHGTTTSERKKSWFIEFNEELSDLWPWAGRNWRNFTLIKIQGELDHMTGRWVFESALLGLGMRITYIYDHSFNEKMMNEKERIIAQLKADTGAKEVYDPEGWLDEFDHKPH